MLAPPHEHALPVTELILELVQPIAVRWVQLTQVFNPLAQRCAVRHVAVEMALRVEVEAEGQGLAERIAAIPGVQQVEPAGANRLRLLATGDVRPEAAAAVVAAGGRLLRLSVEEPSLEAIYSRYFQTHEGELHAT